MRHMSRIEQLWFTFDANISGRRLPMKLVSWTEEIFDDVKLINQHVLPGRINKICSVLYQLASYSIEHYSNLITSQAEIRQGDVGQNL